MPSCRTAQGDARYMQFKNQSTCLYTFECDQFIFHFFSFFRESKMLVDDIQTKLLSAQASKIEVSIHECRQQWDELSKVRTVECN